VSSLLAISASAFSLDGAFSLCSSLTILDAPVVRVTTDSTTGGISRLWNIW
jgi:hypothetical protein